MVPGLQHKSFQSFDGTRIAYQTRGEGPPIVLANGLGGTYLAFRHVYDALGEKYRTICWDYRGLYRSARPKDESTLTMPHHIRDLVTLLDHERVDRAVFIGWSMGVQVNFELFRDHAARSAGVVAINGTYGTPFRTVMASRVTKYVIPALLAAMKARAPLVSKVSTAAMAWQGMIPLMVRMGLVSAAIDGDLVKSVAGDFVTMDFALYSDMLRHLGDHDASDVLPRIGVPVLIITGDRDILTPVSTATRMNRLIPGSRLVIIKGGTHYTPIEYPATIKDEVIRFLGGIPGWEPT